MSALVDSISAQRQEIKSDRMDMSFGEIINMYKDNEITINPEYQRAFRWDVQRQTDFIESILLGIPFPSIFVATNDDGKWELIDGLQRVSTVLSFFGELKDSERNNLQLAEGNIIKDLKGETFETLPLELKLAIKRTPCRIEIIQKESNFEMRYELFKRLNTGGEGLTRQEIRNCIFRGFLNYGIISSMIKELASTPHFQELVQISDSLAQKKLFEELVLRFFSLLFYRHEYTDRTIQDFFDKIMRGQSEKPDQKKIDLFRKTFLAVFDFLFVADNGRSAFRLARLNFSTSMYDAIVLTLADAKTDIATLDGKQFMENVEKLKRDDEFNKHAGAASSNAANIREKLRIAKRVLLGV